MHYRTLYRWVGAALFACCLSSSGATAALMEHIGTLPIDPTDCDCISVHVSGSFWDSCWDGFWCQVDVRDDTIFVTAFGHDSYLPGTYCYTYTGQWSASQVTGMLPPGDYVVSAEFIPVSYRTSEHEYLETSITVTQFSLPVICGDCNCDGLINVVDAVSLVAYIFAPGCGVRQLNSDVNCSGSINISDAVYLISYIFGGGSSPCANCR